MHLKLSVEIFLKENEEKKLKKRKKESLLKRAWHSVKVFWKKFLRRFLYVKSFSENPEDLILTEFRLVGLVANYLWLLFLFYSPIQI
ncbi:MAG TPA: hypothetical protein DIT47_01955 [Flavobacteriaceae bacterium]|nr:hypothetical protein [Flavobacteriaceae bacterium]